MSLARFQEIVQRLTEADTWDQDALAKVGEELGELEELVAQLKRPDLDGLLDGAILLVGLVPRLDPIEAEDCQRMVVRLVQIALRRLKALKNARMKDLARRKARAKEPPRPGMALGDVLIQLGFITPEDLEIALVQAAERGCMLGEALVAMGKVEREDVARAVFLQKSLQPAKKKSPEGEEDADGKQQEGVNDILLGEALLRRGWINPEELLAALRFHEERKIRIGSALIQLGYSTREQVQQALSWQTEMRAKAVPVIAAYTGDGPAPENGGAPAAEAPSPAAATPEAHRRPAATPPAPAPEAAADAAPARKAAPAPAPPPATPSPPSEAPPAIPLSGIPFEPEEPI